MNNNDEDEIVDKIEKATIADAKEILALQKLAYESEAKLYNDFDIPPMVQTLKSIIDDFGCKIFLKATLNDKIIGSARAFVQEGTCHVGRLMVHPDFQNQGIGAKLVNAMENVFKDSKRFELFTGNKSTKNITLYSKLGYKIFKTEKVTDQISLTYLEKIK
ncbi:MAG: GNAT family N-acetyltransferase [Candidatus Nitrosotalea sp.]|nr:GNAT family N-acetyltransferase [Candidatus Nitrosotalea sp.]